MDQNGNAAQSGETLRLAGFVKLRRGIIEHLLSGRITADEFAAYTVMILKADHRNGFWQGNGRKLAVFFYWCPTKGALILKSLASKGYIRIFRKTGMRGSSYNIRIEKYFDQMRPDVSDHRSHTPGHTCSVDQMRPDVSLSQEVILKKKYREEKTVPFPLSEKQRQINAELIVGAGPRPSDYGVRVNPASLERIRAREKRA